MCKDNQTKKEIIRAAAQLFSESGLTATSMQDIADQVGISKPALYYHFTNKEKLITELFEVYHKEYLSTVDSIINSSGTDLEKLEALIKSLIKLRDTNPHFDLICHVGNSLNDQREVAGFMREYKKRFINHLTATIGSLRLFRRHPQEVKVITVMVMGIILSAFVMDKKEAYQVTNTFINVLNRRKDLL